MKLPIATERLTIRTMTADDASSLAAYRSLPDVARYQDWEVPYQLESAARLIAEQPASPEPGEWVQLAVDDGHGLAGDLAVGIDATGTTVTIGYTLAPDRQGQGYATEAVGALVDELFTDPLVHRITATLDPQNIPSARVLEATGFRYEGRSIRAAFVRGEWLDDDRYALLRDDRADWLARPQHRPEHVRLVELGPHNKLAYRDVATQPSQVRLVAPVPKSFMDALLPDHVDGAPVVPWFRGIEADGEPAGFVMLVAVTEHHPVPYLWRLLVDRRHQRRGIGDRVLDLLIARLRAEGNDRLLVSYHPGPGSPEPFYRRRGFVPTGEVHDGEIEAQLSLDDRAGGEP